MIDATKERIWRRHRRDGAGLFPMSDNLAALMALVIVDLSEEQIERERESLINLIFQRGVDLTFGVAKKCSSSLLLKATGSQPGPEVQRAFTNHVQAPPMHRAHVLGNRWARKKKPHQNSEKNPGWPGVRDTRCPGKNAIFCPFFRKSLTPAGRPLCPRDARPVSRGFFLNCLGELETQTSANRIFQLAR